YPGNQHEGTVQYAADFFQKFHGCDLVSFLQYVLKEGSPQRVDGESYYGNNVCFMVAAPLGGITASNNKLQRIRPLIVLSVFVRVGRWRIKQSPKR
ncbi:MAG: hypothetical protein PVH37_29475, partial [Desulfobacterales bacterium]